MDWKKIILISISALIVVLISFVTFGYFSFRRSLPQAEGTVAISALQAPVKIWRDEWGIPHIIARNDLDLYTAVGFVTAQDRMWQMDLFRRAATGTLSEIFGDKTLQADILSRTIGFEKIADKFISELPPESSALLSSYADGVNSYIKNYVERLPIEFSLLGYKPATWESKDSISILRLIGWLLSMGWHVDPVYADLVEKLGLERMQELLPHQVDQNQIMLKSWDHRQAFSGLRFACDEFQKTLGFPSQGVGSNSWVVTGARSRSTLPVLANDTHLPYSAPCLFYILHLSSPNIKAIGISVPGLPGIVIGRNQSIAWGLTNSMIDDIDFYIEKLDSADSSHYLHQGKSQAFAETVELIPIRGKEPYKLIIRSTQNGPIINGVASIAAKNEVPISLRWAGFETGDEFSASQRLLHVQNWQDFLQAAGTFKTPSQNFIYADSKGNIGYYLAAAVPIRNNGQGLFPSDGNMDVNSWPGFVPDEKLPMQYNPAGNRIVTANNRVTSADSPLYLSSYWEPDYRLQRIHSLLDSLKFASAEAFSRQQQDVFSPQAESIVPKVLPIIRQVPFDRRSNYAKALLLWQNWDYQETSESIAATIFEEFYLSLLRGTFADEMGDSLFAEFMDTPHFNIKALDRLVENGNSIWFDDITTSDTTETLKDIIQKSFAASIDSLEAKLGSDMGQWRWGRLHQLTFRHPFSFYKPFSSLFNIGPFRSSGGLFTINNGSYLFSECFANVIGPCMRQVVDMSTQEYNVILTTGQSGHPLSNHYQDQTKLWLKGQMIRLSLDERKIDAQNWKLLTLQSGVN
jgi:penicillin amidase